ncbi:MAG: hypothetical protein II147_01705, partial [Lachnospiraceae bacterium]|nr:hypothetical protein [Lachnospiraceae bacterium]
DKKTVCEEEHYADGVFSDENDLRSKADSSLDFNNHKMYVSVSANVTGEVLGALHSIRYCVEHKEKEAKRICIVYDCEMVNHSIEMINNKETTEKLKTTVERIYFDFCKRVLVENPEIDIVTRHQESHTTGDSDFECFNSLADALCKSETYDMPIDWTKENRPLKKYTDDEITNNVKQISENHSVSTDEAQKTINLRRNAVFRLAENVLQKMSW